METSGAEKVLQKQKKSFTDSLLTIRTDTQHLGHRDRGVLGAAVTLLPYNDNLYHGLTMPVLLTQIQAPRRRRSVPFGSLSFGCRWVRLGAVRRFSTSTTPPPPRRRLRRRRRPISVRTSLGKGDCTGAIAPEAEERETVPSRVKGCVTFSSLSKKPAWCNDTVKSSGLSGWRRIRRSEFDV